MRGERRREEERRGHGRRAKGGKWRRKTGGCGKRMEEGCMDDSLFQKQAVAAGSRDVSVMSPGPSTYGDERQLRDMYMYGMTRSCVTSQVVHTSCL